MRRPLVAVAAIALALTACDGQESDQDAAPPPTSTNATTETSAPAPASHLMVEPSGTSVCLDDVPDGDVLAYTGPAIVVKDGSATITGIRYVSSQPLRLHRDNVLAMRYRIDDVRHPPLVTADTARGIGRPAGYVRDSRGPLVGTTFESGAEGFVPFLEAGVDWAGLHADAPGSDAWVRSPQIAITYTDSTGATQTLQVPTRITLHSADHRC
jgi:hypothetical protein